MEHLCYIEKSTIKREVKIGINGAGFIILADFINRKSPFNIDKRGKFD